MIKNKNIIESFKSAWRGFVVVWKTERNFKIMTVAAIFVIGAMFYFPTSQLEKLVLSGAVFFVLTLELLNALIEKIFDFIHQEEHDLVKVIKDTMASVVLMASLGALIVGLLIFWHYLVF